MALQTIQVNSRSLTNFEPPRSMGRSMEVAMRQVKQMVHRKRSRCRVAGDRLVVSDNKSASTQQNISNCCVQFNGEIRATQFGLRCFELDRKPSGGRMQISKHRATRSWIVSTSAHLAANSELDFDALNV